MTQPHSSSEDSDSQDSLHHARQFLARLESMTPPAGLTKESSSLATRAKRLWEELVEVAEQLVEKESSSRSDGERAARKEPPTLRLRPTDEAKAPASRPRFKRQGSMPSAASLFQSSAAPPPVPPAPRKVATKPPVAKEPVQAQPVIEKAAPVQLPPAPPKIVAQPVLEEPPVPPPEEAESPIADSLSRAPVLMPAPTSPPRRLFKKIPAPPKAEKTVPPPKMEKKDPPSKTETKPGPSPKAKTKTSAPPKVKGNVAAPARTLWKRQEWNAETQQMEVVKPLANSSAQEPDQSEIGLAIHWWSAPVFLALSLMIAAVIGGLGAETLRVSAPQAELTRVLRRPESTPDQVRQAARQLVSSPLTRYSANRDLLMAEATARVHDESNENGDTNAIKHLERASAKEPISDWHRLNFAHAAKVEASRSEDVAASWNILAKSRSAEPLFQEQVAFHRVEMGDLADATEQFKRMLKVTPERADSIVGQLLTQRVSLQDALEVVPNSPIALMKLYELSERETVIGLRKQIEVRLTQIDAGAPNSEAVSWKPEDWGALGTLFQGFERWDDAAEAWQKGVTADPSRRDWMFSLARARFEQKRFEECEDALAELLASKLAPGMISQVKALQDQLTSARAEEAMPAGRPLSPATLRAN